MFLNQFVKKRMNAIEKSSSQEQDEVLKLMQGKGVFPYEYKTNEEVIK